MKLQKHRQPPLRVRLTINSKTTREIFETERTMPRLAAYTFRTARNKMRYGKPFRRHLNSPKFPLRIAKMLVLRDVQAFELKETRAVLESRNLM